MTSPDHDDRMTNIEAWLLPFGEAGGPMSLPLQLIRR